MGLRIICIKYSDHYSSALLDGAFLGVISILLVILFLLSENTYYTAKECILETDFMIDK